MRQILSILCIMTLMAFSPSETKTYKLELTSEEVQVIYDVLGELPAKKSEAIRFKIVQQVNEQNRK